MSAGADRLRRAAHVLTDRAQVAHEQEGADVRLDIVLADWLDYTAKAANAKGRHHAHANRVADTILRPRP